MDVNDGFNVIITMVVGPRARVRVVGGYAMKLFLALYYWHADHAVPAIGGIPFIWYFDATHPDRWPPVELLANYWQGVPEPVRQGTSLGGQLAYLAGAPTSART